MKKNTTTFRDLVAITILFVIVYVVASYADLFEMLVGLTQRYEAVQLDEIFTLMILASLIFGVFSYSRWRELRREISERERAQEALEQLNEDLEERKRELERHTADLSRTNRELKQRNEENEMFVYSVSHDLRSPLVNLEGFSQELLMVSQDLRELFEQGDLPPDVKKQGIELVDEDVATSIHFIRTGVSRLSDIIDALLRLSRVGRVDYRWQEVEVEPVVTRITDAMKTTVDEKGARIDAAHLPPTWGDATAIEQIFANLISNALNYLDKERPGLIEVGGEAADDGLNTYYVKDNGVGIPEEHKSKVFQIFQRLQPETEGEGLGLTLVRRIVERHGGRIWVESVEGEGSTFFVQLPGVSSEDRPDGVPVGAANRVSIYRNL